MSQLGDVTVPPPESVPFESQDERTIYLHQYREGFASGMTGVSICPLFLADIPHRGAHIKGWYDGQAEGLNHSPWGMHGPSGTDETVTDLPQDEEAQAAQKARSELDDQELEIDKCREEIRGITEEIATLRQNIAEMRDENRLVGFSNAWDQRAEKARVDAYPRKEMLADLHNRRDALRKEEGALNAELDVHLAFMHTDPKFEPTDSGRKER